MEIAISQRVVFDKSSRETRDVLDQDWYKFASSINIRLYPIPNKINNVEEYIYKLNLDGVIFSGGNNIGSQNKILFKSKTLINDDVSLSREKVEIKLLNWSIQNKKPVIGVCKGMQFINSYFDGHQSLTDSSKHVNKMHEVRFIDKKFIKIYGKSQIVNSYHNFGINRNNLSADLIPTSISDNEIESFKHVKNKIYGIMWHPERNIPFNKSDIELFKNVFYK
ncbi:MAG: hypothetical protein CMC91_03760 [Flavobacteriaceae bacterium]|nr:hypothetical protein [Flavobacteriaceae bacterium]|tara:strand:- start:22503 stop:23168 length:666 start_codon:yes stop_codon:yes gene_type:complete